MENGIINPSANQRNSLQDESSSPPSSPLLSSAHIVNMHQPPIHQYRQRNVMQEHPRRQHPLPPRRTMYPLSPSLSASTSPPHHNHHNADVPQSHRLISRPADADNLFGGDTSADDSDIVPIPHFNVEQFQEEPSASYRLRRCPRIIERNVLEVGLCFNLLSIF